MRVVSDIPGTSSVDPDKLSQQFWQAVNRRQVQFDGRIRKHRPPRTRPLLIAPRQRQPDLAALLKAIKRPFSYRVKQRLLASGSRLLERLTVQERPGVTCFRFWQEGPGYDRNLSTPAAVLAAIDDIHLNPVRRGLCERAIDWKWSSARRFVLPDQPVDRDLPTMHGLPADFW